ncbi:hypothetical protein DFJ77DRAFT_243376 [Powellomyces hirtus]|nr:hypothetical protein DFJ77DRAFT_243376 [Powellomyces hirtus]
MIEELLSLLPQTQGGLFPIATGLFFGRWEARRATVRLLRRVGWDKVGKKFIAHLNPMIRLAYLRAHREFYGDEPVPGVVVRALQGDKTRGPAGGGPSMHASLKVPTSTTDGESKSAASSTGPSPNSSPAPVRSTLGVAPTTSSSQTSLSAQSQSNTTTPPSTVPVSPLVKRMLLQQQQRQELLKAKLTALGNETPALMFQDTLNPDFGRRDVSPPEDGRTGIEQQQQPQEQQQLHPIVTNGLQQQPIPAASAASHAGKAPVNPPPSGPTPLAPKRFQSMPTSTNSSPYSSPPRQQQPPETAAVGAAKTPLLPPLVTSVSAKTSPHRHPAPQLPHASPHQLNPQQQQPSQPSPASPYYPPKSPYSSPGTPAACIPHHDQSSAASSFSITEHTVRIGNITPTSARLSAAPTISASFVVPPPINTTTTTTLRILSGYNDNSIGNSLETLGSLPDEQRSDDDGHGQRASYIEDDPDDSYGNFMQFYGQDEDSPSP